MCLCDLYKLKMRLGIISELKIVDEAILGHEDDIYLTVEELKPDIIALGYDQIFDEKKIKMELEKRNLNVKIVRLPKYSKISDLNGTRRIINKIISAYEFQKNMENIEGK